MIVQVVTFAPRCTAAGCGRLGDPRLTQADAVRFAKRIGWFIDEAAGEAICPNCASRQAYDRRPGTERSLP